EMVHLFAITQISELHLRTLHWLSGHLDVRLYHLNPLAGTRNEERGMRNKQQAAQSAPLIPHPSSLIRHPSSVHCHLQAWGKAGAESLYLATQLLSPPNAFQLESLASPRKAAQTVLGRLQSSILEPPEAYAPGSPIHQMPQDKSVQIAACPGIYREV